jgi:gamma-glutamylcyclotransferase (GGCT)/AIG2-like uncharacterized protein YtfP
MDRLDIEAPPPIRQAAAIPVEAAGREPLFFFGTLMDIEVLAHVLARPLAPEQVVPAWIEGFRRMGTAGRGYPILVPAEGGLLEGRLLRYVSRRDIARINHYESGEYRAELRRVSLGDGTRVPAWLYLALDHLVADGGLWELEAWQARHKLGFFAACDGWMADFAEPS